MWLQRNDAQRVPRAHGAQDRRGSCSRRCVGIGGNSRGWRQQRRRRPRCCSDSRCHQRVARSLRRRVVVCGGADSPLVLCSVPSSALSRRRSLRRARRGRARVAVVRPRSLPARRSLAAAPQAGAQATSHGRRLNAGRARRRRRADVPGRRSEALLQHVFQVRDDVRAGRRVGAAQPPLRRRRRAAPRAQVVEERCPPRRLPRGRQCPSRRCGGATVPAAARCERARRRRLAAPQH
jgi:hypothetical protein